MSAPHNPKHTFLCPRHRQQASAHPQRCLAMCCRLQKVARKELLAGRMDRAFAYYGTAFEASQLLMAQGRSLAKLNDFYITLALEFVYICRRYNARIDLAELIGVIRQPLLPLLPAQELMQALAPVFDIAFAPLTKAQGWIHQLIQQDRHDRRLH